MTRNDGTIAGFFPATVMPDPDWWQALWREPEKVFAALGVPSGLKVVDLCCGDGLFTVPLQNVQGSAKYVGNPANQLIDGLLFGFLNESDANTIIVNVPILGNTPLSKFLPGGSGNCDSHTAKDIGPMGQPGWYFYLNYTAHLVNWPGS